jgi:disulfide bond formation protein DsbB
MRSGTASRARQILLLCALTLSVLGMHHVALPSHEVGHAAMTAEPMPTMATAAMAPATTAPAMASMNPAAQPSDDSGTSTGHDLLHLCLVVLCAAAVFLLATWLLATVSATRADPGNQRPSLPRAPRVAGRSLLASVCVLRL